MITVWSFMRVPFCFVFVNLWPRVLMGWIFSQLQLSALWLANFICSDHLVCFSMYSGKAFSAAEWYNSVTWSHSQQNTTESVVCVVLTSLLITLQVTIFAKSRSKVLLHVLFSTTTKNNIVRQFLLCCAKIVLQLVWWQHCDNSCWEYSTSQYNSTCLA